MQRSALLDGLNSHCGAELSKEFAKLGIFAWYDSSVPRSACRGGAFFATYDPIETCFRLFPSSTRYFQASVLANLIPPKQAVALSSPLIDLSAQILPSYEGRFANELKTSLIRRYIGNDCNAAEFSLLEAQMGLFPDVLYGAAPRLSALRHFREGEFSAIALKKDEIFKHAQCPVAALGIAAELVSLGPGLNLNPRTIKTVLEWIREAVGLPGKRSGTIYQNLHAERIVIPTFSHGLQGIVFGFFHNLEENKKGFVRNLLHQFGQRMADAAAFFRQKRFIRATERIITVREFTLSLLEFLSPVEHLTAKIGGEYQGYHLRQEGECWHGYRKLNQAEANALSNDADNEIVDLVISEQKLRIYVKYLTSFAAIESALTWLKANICIERVAATPISQPRMLPLQLTNLEAVSATLNHQIDEGYGVYVACRNLYVIECMRRNYATGETTLTNSRCQEFMRKRLAKSNVTGYQVCGKALDKLKLDFNRLLPDQIAFEPLASRAARARWHQEPAETEIMDPGIQ